MSLYPIAEDYLDAGLRLIPLYALINGKCACADPDCPAAAKHPLRSNWQHQALVDSATMREVWGEAYTCNGFGFALDPDHLVLDIDPRNGGTESLKLLQEDLKIDFFEVCSAIVKTGGGGLHFYFKKSDETNLGWKLPAKYRGADIKQFGGFVVIAGSIHVSGTDYEWYNAAKSDLENLAEVPAGLAQLLTHTYTEHRAQAKSEGLGDIDEIKDMLDFITADAPYQEWVQIGMAIHHATNGAGFDIWDTWSRTGIGYKEGECSRKWHGFGKNNGNPVGMGTLVKIAQNAGWSPNSDTAFLTPEELASMKETWNKKRDDRASLPSISDDSDIDLHSPPGLLGRVNSYIYDCSVFPNKNLALACSLSVLTNVIGRKYYWPGRFSNIQPNLLILCIAGSSTGKDSVLKAANKLLTSINLGPAIHGRIKSEKDLLDALECNQYALYFNDEFGFFLQRLNNAMKKGNASYLEGIIATIMEVFTKGDASVLLDISRKKAIREEWENVIANMSKALEDGNGNSAIVEKKLNRAKMLLAKFMNGFPNPFLSMFTTATPRTMELAFSGDATENGFLSRAMTFHENETNPRPKPDFKGSIPVPMGLQIALKNVKFDQDDCPFGRIDSFDQVAIPITIDKEAQIFVDRAIDYFFDLAETQKEVGLESLPRRALDGVVKVCIALAAEDRHLTLQMARYAVKLVRSEIDKKIRRVNSTENMHSRDTIEKMDGINSRVCEICSTSSGETAAVIYNQVKSTRVSRELLFKVLDELVASARMEEIDQNRSYNGIKIFKYKTTTLGGA